YYHGSPGQLSPYDARILRYFSTAADEGQVRARITLAKVYAAGVGVPKDTARAIGLLKSTPHEDAQRLLQEISTAPEAVPPAPVGRKRRPQNEGGGARRGDRSARARGGRRRDARGSARRHRVRMVGLRPASGATAGGAAADHRRSRCSERIEVRSRL